MGSMPDLRKDAIDIGANDWLWCDAALVLLVIGLRGKMDVPFIRAVTGLPYHDILVMCVRLKLGAIVRDDDTPVIGSHNQPRRASRGSGAQFHGDGPHARHF